MYKWTIGFGLIAPGVLVSANDWWLLTRVRGLWEKIRLFIPRLCFFLKSEDWLAQANANFTLYARISPQWLSELRRL